MAEETYKLPFFGAETTSAPEPAPEPVAEAAPQPEAPVESLNPVSEQPRAPDGKFAPKVETPAAAVVEPEPVAAAPQPAGAAPAAEPLPAAALTPPEGFVPLATVQAERDKRQALERELAELRAKPAAASPPPPPPAPVAAQPLPDPATDPDGYRFAVESQAVQRVAATSRYYAERQHGAEVVQAAWDWATTRAANDPALDRALWESRDPANLMVTEHRRALAVGRIANLSPAEWDRFMSGAPAQPADPAAPAPPAAPVIALAPAPAPPPPPPVAIPPPSITSATSAGGLAHVVVSPDAAYKGLFHKE